MHYKNGREAKNGDKVVLFPSYGSPVVGILYDATAGNDYCNGKIAPILQSDPCPNLKEVLHLDDVLSRIAYFPKDCIGRDVGPERVEAAVRMFALIWEHSLFDCDPQDYETMARDILEIMAIPHI